MEVANLLHFLFSQFWDIILKTYIGLGKIDPRLWFWSIVVLGLSLWFVAGMLRQYLFYITLVAGIAYANVLYSWAGIALWAAGFLVGWFLPRPQLTLGKFRSFRCSVPLPYWPALGLALWHRTVFPEWAVVILLGLSCAEVKRCAMLLFVWVETGRD